MYTPCLCPCVLLSPPQCLLDCCFDCYTVPFDHHKLWTEEFLGIFQLIFSLVIFFDLLVAGSVRIFNPIGYLVSSLSSSLTLVGLPKVAKAKSTHFMYCTSCSGIGTVTNRLTQWWHRRIIFLMTVPALTILEGIMSVSYGTVKPRTHCSIMALVSRHSLTLLGLMPWQWATTTLPMLIPDACELMAFGSGALMSDSWCPVPQQQVLICSCSALGLFRRESWGCRQGTCVA